MQIQTDIIQAYGHGEIPSMDTWFYAYTNGSAPIAANRQEICARLNEECSAYQRFPLWNRELITALFPDYERILRNIIIMPIIGATPTFDATLIHHEDQPYLLLDLLNIADYTQSVKEMCYILHNLCHIQLLRELFHQRFPQLHDPQEQLNYRFFCEGWILYLAWNENLNDYVFHTAAYNKIKQKAFLTLYQALNTDATQVKGILSVLDQAELWDRFPDIAGMFFCDDVFHHQGITGLQSYFSLGWKDCANRLFTPADESA